METLTYLILNSVVLGVALAIGRRYVSLRSRPFAIALAGLLLLTLVFDNILIALSVYAYTPGTHLGVLLGLAPLEDFFYPVVSLLLVVTIWNAPERHNQPPKEKEHHA